MLLERRPDIPEAEGHPLVLEEAEGVVMAFFCIPAGLTEI
jgi:hypothetical protein